MTAFSLATSAHVPTWLTAVIAFTVVMCSEIAWVLCVRWSAQSRIYRAACGAASMVLIGWLGLIVLLGNPLVAIPSEMAGAFTGTIIAIKLDRK